MPSNKEISTIISPTVNDKLKHHNKRKFHSKTEYDEDDDSFSTTDSDHQELLRIIKKRKLAKLKAGQQFDSPLLSVNHKKRSESPTTMDSDGPTLLSKIPSHGKAPDENVIRQTFKSVWSNMSVSGGYQVKLHYIKTPSMSNYYPVVVDVTNNSGQNNIFIKGRTFIEVLKGYAIEITKHYKEVAREVNLPFFIEVVQNSKFIDVRKNPHGSNEYKAGYVNNREYKDHIMFFMIPSGKGSLNEVMRLFKTFLFNVFSSPYFFILMESYTKLIPNQGGDIGKHLRVKDSDAWKILKREENYEIVCMDALDAKLMDEDINKVLESMFPKVSHKDGYQRLGWKNKICAPFFPIKQEKPSDNGV